MHPGSQAPSLRCLLSFLILCNTLETQQSLHIGCAQYQPLGLEITTAKSFHLGLLNQLGVPYRTSTKPLSFLQLTDPNKKQKTRKTFAIFRYKVSQFFYQMVSPPFPTRKVCLAGLSHFVAVGVTRCFNEKSGTGREEAQGAQHGHGGVGKTWGSLTPRIYSHKSWETGRGKRIFVKISSNIKICPDDD